ncbi:hypothetical protein GOBAR_AA12462 [Gossypium barbadense]|uniref:Uncharacterized protein n=2 Tax=Gossypium TaxID=3633 RepID=A0A2P5XXW6_GOSBA|nr:hypothetical protein GOBAR_AA12462 [Gossypium barbadense]TYG89003.1 hypothetical protein ES288_A12G066300v1 [Gossypium darwinii]
MVNRGFIEPRGSVGLAYQPQIATVLRIISCVSKRRYGCALEYGGLGVARLLRRWHRMEGGRGAMWLLRRKMKAVRVSLF